jgi:hypothetical protein
MVNAHFKCRFIPQLKGLIDVINYVVTPFWTSRAGDGVYLFWTEYRSLAYIRQKIDKSTERNILFFETLCWINPSKVALKKLGSAAAVIFFFVPT